MKNSRDYTLVRRNVIRVYSILYTVHSILYTVYCILYTAYCILYTVHSILYTVHSILYTVSNFSNLSNIYAYLMVDFFEDEYHNFCPKHGYCTLSF